MDECRGVLGVVVEGGCPLGQWVSGWRCWRVGWNYSFPSLPSLKAPMTRLICRSWGTYLQFTKQFMIQQKKINGGFLLWNGLQLIDPLSESKQMWLFLFLLPLINQDQPTLCCAAQWVSCNPSQIVLVCDANIVLLSLCISQIKYFQRLW